MMAGQVLFQGKSEIDQIFKIFSLLGLPSIQDWPEFASLPHHMRTFPRFRRVPLETLFPGAEQRSL